MERPPDNADQPDGKLHVRCGWLQVLVFMLLGIVLEAMHGFKVGWYLNAGEETRRMLLTLAHAHGVLLGLMNIAFGLTIESLDPARHAVSRLASPLLLAGCVLLPFGFLLGGLVTFGGDPGFGIFLVAPGAVCLVAAISLLVWTVFRSR